MRFILSARASHIDRSVGEGSQGFERSRVNCRKVCQCRRCGTTRPARIREQNACDSPHTSEISRSDDPRSRGKISRSKSIELSDPSSINARAARWCSAFASPLALAAAPPCAGSTPSARCCASVRWPACANSSRIVGRAREEHDVHSRRRCDARVRSSGVPQSRQRRASSGPAFDRRSVLGRAMRRRVWVSIVGAEGTMRAEFVADRAASRMRMTLSTIGATNAKSRGVSFASVTASDGARRHDPSRCSTISAKTKRRDAKRPSASVSTSGRAASITSSANEGRPATST